MLKWDDLRYFLVVAHHESAFAGNCALGVDHLTVRRRVAECTRRIGLPLIKLDQNGGQLTSIGVSLLAQVVRQQALERPEQQVAAASPYSVVAR